jgi:hypothetical protein
MKAKYPEDQEKLENTLVEFEKVVDELINDPFHIENRKRLRELEIKIATLAGEEIYDIYFESFK